jgi:hypothetical protein
VAVVGVWLRDRGGGFHYGFHKTDDL